MVVVGVGVVHPTFVQAHQPVLCVVGVHVRRRPFAAREPVAVGVIGVAHVAIGRVDPACELVEGVVAKGRRRPAGHTLARAVVGPVVAVGRARHRRGCGTRVRAVVDNLGRQPVDPVVAQNRRARRRREARLVLGQQAQVPPGVVAIVVGVEDGAGRRGVRAVLLAAERIVVGDLPLAVGQVLGAHVSVQVVVVRRHAGPIRQGREPVEGVVVADQQPAIAAIRAAVLGATPVAGQVVDVGVGRAIAGLRQHSAQAVVGVGGRRRRIAVVVGHRAQAAGRIVGVGAVLLGVILVLDVLKTVAPVIEVVGALPIGVAPPFLVERVVGECRPLVLRVGDRDVAVQPVVAIVGRLPVAVLHAGAVAHRVVAVRHRQRGQHGVGGRRGGPELVAVRVGVDGDVAVGVGDALRVAVRVVDRAGGRLHPGRTAIGLDDRHQWGRNLIGAVCPVVERGGAVLARVRRGDDIAHAIVLPMQVRLPRRAAVVVDDRRLVLVGLAVMPVEAVVRLVEQRIDDAGHVAVGIEDGLRQRAHIRRMLRIGGRTKRLDRTAGSVVARLRLVE